MNENRIEKIRELINDAIEFGKSPPNYGCDSLSQALIELFELRKYIDLLKASDDCSTETIGKIDAENKKLKEELKEVTDIANRRLCDSCKQEHPIDVMCPSHEVRMHEDMWYHKAIQKLDVVNKKLENSNENLKVDIAALKSLRIKLQQLLREAIISEKQGNRYVNHNLISKINKELVEKTDDGFRLCKYCGCNTNAKMRACCDAGRDDDEFAAKIKTNWSMD